MTTTAGDATIPTESDTHVIFVKNDPNYPIPIFRKDLKAATDEARDIITANHTAECFVFQIKTVLTGHIKIVDKNFTT